MCCWESVDVLHEFIDLQTIDWTVCYQIMCYCLLCTSYIHYLLLIKHTAYCVCVYCRGAVHGWRTAKGGSVLCAGGRSTVPHLTLGAAAEGPTRWAQRQRYWGQEPVWWSPGYQPHRTLYTYPPSEERTLSLSLLHAHTDTTHTTHYTTAKILFSVSDAWKTDPVTTMLLLLCKHTVM